MKIKYYYIYMLTNQHNSVLYVGITGNLLKRIYEHQSGLVKGFTKKYNLNKLVYFEFGNDAYYAIKREKQLKRWRREWKVALIEKDNPFWQDLSIGLR